MGPRQGPIYPVQAPLRHRKWCHGSTAQVDIAMLAATALSLALALAPPTAPPSLKPCKGESDCISSNGLEAPNHFQAPLAFSPKTRDRAFAARRDSYETSAPRSTTVQVISRRGV